MRKITLCAVLIVLIIGILLYAFCPNLGTSALMRAIEKENIQQVERYLERGIDPNQPNVRPGWWWTLMEYAPQRPLAVACKVGNYEIVKTLIDYGATAEAVENLNWSPLYRTVAIYHPDDEKIVALLLENGADPHCDEGSGALPVFWAADMLPKVRDKNQTNGTAYFDGYDETTAKGITEIVLLLLGDDSVNVTDGNKNLLMVAAERENIHLVKVLLAKGCNKEYQDRDGRTAYDYALKTGNSELIDLLQNGNGQ